MSKVHKIPRVVSTMSFKINFNGPLSSGSLRSFGKRVEFDIECVAKKEEVPRKQTYCMT
jgi:hypothetical protein